VYLRNWGGRVPAKTLPELFRKYTEIFLTVYLGRQLVALKRVGFSLADNIQSDALSPSHLHLTAFSIDLFC